MVPLPCRFQLKCGTSDGAGDGEILESATFFENLLGDDLNIFKSSSYNPVVSIGFSHEINRPAIGVPP